MGGILRWQLPPHAEAGAVPAAGVNGQPYAVSLSVRGLLQPILLVVQGLALKSVAAETTTNFKELIAKSQLNINEGTPL